MTFIRWPLAKLTGSLDSSGKDALKTAALAMGFMLSIMISSPVTAAPGDLDASFGAAGKVVLPIGSGSDFGADIAVQPDGKIVFAGHCHDQFGLFDFCVVRHETDGTLDETFGVAGIAVTPIGSFSDEAYALIIQSDGRIILAGNCGGETSHDFCVARFTASGSLDETFGGSGFVTTPLATVEGFDVDDYARGAVIQPDGKILLAGGCGPVGAGDFCLARYNFDGSLDGTFGEEGVVITALATDDFGESVTLEPSGKILVVGGCSGALCLLRYTSQGILDTQFGNSGVSVLPNAIGHSVLATSDGEILVGGECVGPDNTLDFCLARFASSGELDPGFGNGGMTVNSVGAGTDSAISLARRPDGAIFLGGFCQVEGWNAFCLARYTEDGLIDEEFGNSGAVLSPITGDDYAFGSALQADGKVLLGGYCWGGSTWDFCLARFDGGPLDLTARSRDDCLEQNWRSHTRTDGTGFKNQGDCVRWVLTGN